MTSDEALPPDMLADQWHSFRLRGWNRLKAALRQAEEAGEVRSVIAAQLGLSERRLKRIMSGKINVSLRTMHDIARALGRRPELYFVVPTPAGALSSER